jgi:hypothetical protein
MIVYFKPINITNYNNEGIDDIPILTSFSMAAGDYNNKIYNYVEYDVIPIKFFNFTMYLISFVPELNTIDKIKDKFAKYKLANGGIHFSAIDQIICKINYESKNDSNLDNYVFCCNAFNFNILGFNFGMSALRYSN